MFKKSNQKETDLFSLHDQRLVLNELLHAYGVDYISKRCLVSLFSQIMPIGPGGSAFKKMPDAFIGTHTHVLLWHYALAALFAVQFIIRTFPLCSWPSECMINWLVRRTSVTSYIMSYVMLWGGISATLLEQMDMILHSTALVVHMGGQ